MLAFIKLRSTALRGLTTAAPLKLRDLWAILRERLPALRGLTTAAPLKREGLRIPSVRGSDSPRSHDRGPVEASQP